MADEYEKMMAPLWKAAANAQKRDRLRMLAFIHHSLVFDSGMSDWCKVCGARQQSLMPTSGFEHRPECPLTDIRREVLVLGGWPDHEDYPSWEYSEE